MHLRPTTAQIVQFVLSCPAVPDELPEGYRCALGTLSLACRGNSSHVAASSAIVAEGWQTAFIWFWGSWAHDTRSAVGYDVTQNGELACACIDLRGAHSGGLTALNGQNNMQGS